MHFFFDASAILNMVKRGHLKPFLAGATLDLARYEAIKPYGRSMCSSKQ